MLKYIIIFIAVALIALAAIGGYFYFTNPTSLYEPSVVSIDEEVMESSDGVEEIDTMETEINSLDVTTDSGDISDEDLMGL